MAKPRKTAAKNARIEIPARAKFVLQLKITLKDVKPVVWRRVLVSTSKTLEDLHGIIQAVMGWEHSHLHCFKIGHNDYGDLSMSADGELGFEDERRVKLSLLAVAKLKFRYEYDFGDSWRHDIVVEQILPDGGPEFSPACIAGANACPPEDCGGASGYANLCAILKNPRHKEYEAMAEWAPAGFDPTAFDLAAANRAVRR